MSFITSNNKLVLLSGKDNLYVVDPNEISAPVIINLAKVRPTSASGQKEVTPAEKISLVCAGISPDSNYVGASDSEKNVFVYKRGQDGWSPLAIFTTEKRLLKFQFTQNSSHIVMTDKCGDVWIRSLSLETQNEDDAKLKKILGHCSVILDTCLNAANTEIYTSDRDEKVRVSSFPDSYNINGYYLGHKEAVLFISLVHNDTHLISCDIEGNLRVWNVDNKACAINFNLFSLLNLAPAAGDATGNSNTSDKQIRFVKITEINKKVYIATRISSYDQLCVFDFDLESLTTQLVGEIPMGPEEFDFCWIGNVLYVVSLDAEKGLGRVSVCSDNGNKLSECGRVTMENSEDILKDVQLFVKFNEVTNIPLRKRQGYDGGEKGPANKVRVTDESSINAESAS